MVVALTTLALASPPDPAWIAADLIREDS